MDDSIQTRVTELFGIRYPIVQGGMAWVSGWKLAAAVSNAGGLGILGSATMAPPLLSEHIRKLQAASDKPFGVNITLTNRDVEETVNTCLDHGVKIIFTSAGSPKRFTPRFKQSGAKVVHVAPSITLARKVEDAGCDAVVAEGMESGGHNGFEEIASTCLWPGVADAVDIPVIAAGGIVDGRGLASALALGADGVQVGTRFALTTESSANLAYKTAALGAQDADARLHLRQFMPTRSIVNDYVERIINAESSGAPKDELMKMRGYNRSRIGIFEGDLKEGDLEIGQGVGRIGEIIPAEEVVRQMVAAYHRTIQTLARMSSKP